MFIDITDGRQQPQRVGRFYRLKATTTKGLKALHMVGNNHKRFVGTIDDRL